MPPRTLAPAVLPGLLVVTVLLSSALAHADDDTRARLDKGEIFIETRDVEGVSLPEATVTAVINAPPEKVWKLVERCADYSRTMPRIKESKELSREGERVRCALTFSAPWPLRDLQAVTVARHEVKPGKWSRSWELEAGDYDRNEGSWVLTPFDEEGKRTLAVYRLLSSPHLSVPDSIQRMAVKRALPDLIKTLRKQVE